MKVQAIIPTAGLGTRMSSVLPKPLVMLKDKPLFIYALKAFEKSKEVASVVLVVSDSQMAEFEKYVKQYNISKVTKIVVGGQTRKDSVYNGLSVLDQDTDIVLIHDGARPLITADLIDAAITHLCEDDGLVLGVPIKPTIKRIDTNELIIEETLSREDIWEIQTPQVFKKDILINAHQKGREVAATDDATLVENMGGRVKVLLGQYSNIKITTDEDLVVAEALLNEEKVSNGT